MTVEADQVGGQPDRPSATKVLMIVAVAALVGTVAVGLAREGTPPATKDRGHLDVTLTDFNGARFTLDTYRGRPVVVNFWASWCPSCTAEMPAFERVYQRLEQRVAFVGINQSDSRTAAEELARSTGVTYRLAQDTGGQAFAAFGGRGMPTTVLIDERGAVVQIVAGALSEEQLASLIDEHLGVGV